MFTTLGLTIVYYLDAICVRKKKNHILASYFSPLFYTKIKYIKENIKRTTNRYLLVSFPLYLVELKTNLDKGKINEIESLK